MKRCLVRVPVFIALLTALAFADPKPPDTFLDPEKAGPDFVVQGEYDGQVGGKDRLGAQVVAEGKSKFAVIFLPGGLPGDGWDGKTRIKAVAKTEDDKTIVEGNGWKGDIADGKLTGKAADGLAFRLKRVVRKSLTEGAKPPDGATVLFDGSGVAEWKNGKIVEEKLLAQGPTTKKEFKDFKLHVEFRLPFKPQARGQSRGNSGVYLQQRYEIQILDSFGLEPKPNDCTAVYEQVAPSVNMCYPPLSWQTFDIDFTAARFDASGKKTKNAVVTVLHNGVKVHDAVEIKSETGHGQKEVDTPGPIYLQNHGNPVYFRNIWIVER
jgi:hypothetical protein